MAERERMEQLVGGHYACGDDTWYSCPKSEEGSSDERKGDECDCSLDARVARLEEFRRETWNAALESVQYVIDMARHVSEWEIDRHAIEEYPELSELAFSIKSLKLALALAAYEKAK